MTIKIPNPPDVTAMREERDALDAKIRAASSRWESRVQKALADVQPDDIESLDDVMVLLGAPGRRAYDLVEAWIKSLGSRDMRFDGMLLDAKRKEYVGPAVMVTVWHPSQPEAEARNSDLCIALSRYMDFLEPVTEHLGAEGVVVKVMDNDLSASGIPEVYIHRDGSCEFAMTRHGRTTVEREWPSLTEAVEWLSRNRWYGEPYPEREECW